MLKSTSLVSFPSKAQCKQTQLCCMYMLRPVAHPVACCCGKFEKGETFELPTFLLDSFAGALPTLFGPRTHQAGCRTQRALSFQKKFRFEISKNPNAQWKVHSSCTVPTQSQCSSGYCCCKQDAKEWYWGQRFCQTETDVSVRPTDRPTEMNGPVKMDHLRKWFQIFRSNRTEFWRSGKRLRSYGLYSSHDALQVPTMLGVVAPVCR